jgi:hypothetical protein
MQYNMDHTPTEARTHTLLQYRYEDRTTAVACTDTTQDSMRRIADESTAWVKNCSSCIEVVVAPS